MKMGRSKRDRSEQKAFVAAFKFLALVFVLLLLPNKNLDLVFGLNPQRLWLIVVFIAGLSFLGYLLSKVVDPATAISLTGILGGAVSPGMTITSLTEQYKRYPAFDLDYTFAGAIASTMLFSRNFIVVKILSPALAQSLLVPFAAMAGVGIAVIGLLRIRTRSRDPPTGELDTPFRIRSALVIGAVIAVVLVLINNFEVSLPSNTTRVGIVVATIAQLSIYVVVTWTAGAKKMAQVIAVILLGSASVGISLVLIL